MAQSRPIGVPTVTIRPRWTFGDFTGSFISRNPAYPILAVMLMAGAALSNPRQVGVATLAGTPVVLVAVAAWVTIHLARSIDVHGDDLVVHRPGATRRLRKTEIAKVHLLSIQRRTGPPAKAVVFESVDAHPIFRMSGAFWRRTDLEQICRRLGIAIDGDWTNVVDVIALQQWGPASLSWREANPDTYYGLIFPAGVLAIVLLVVLVASHALPT